MSLLLSLPFIDAKCITMHSFYRIVKFLNHFLGWFSALVIDRDLRETTGNYTAVRAGMRMG